MIAHSTIALYQHLAAAHDTAAALEKPSDAELRCVARYLGTQTLDGVPGIMSAHVIVEMARRFMATDEGGAA